MQLLSRHFLVLLVMSLSFFLSFYLKPTKSIEGQKPSFKLEEIIPKTLGSWEYLPSNQNNFVSPEVKQTLDKIYSQILTREYIDEQKNVIMLSIAYGGNQSNDTMQVHRPEYCYRAQGFMVGESFEETLDIGSKSLAIRNLIANQGHRQEQISYWITIGNKSTLPGFQRKLIQIAYGLSGQVPDGMLIRVSTISNDSEKGYALNKQFIRELINGMSHENLTKIIGKGSV